MKTSNEKKKQKFDYTNITGGGLSDNIKRILPDNLVANIELDKIKTKKKFKNVEVFKSDFRPLKLSLSDLKERIFLKLITNKSNDKVVGLHYLGENAAEIIQGFSVALVKGLKKRDFDKTVGIHPSSAEEIVTLKN